MTVVENISKALKTIGADIKDLKHKFDTVVKPSTFSVFIEFNDVAKIKADDNYAALSAYVETPVVNDLLFVTYKTNDSLWGQKQYMYTQRGWEEIKILH